MRINSLRETEDYKAAASALGSAEDDPEAVIILTSAYIERLLRLGETMVHAEFLSVGYWIDRITIALARLKCWREAEVWLERFFTLPERYQKGSSQSEQDSMKKRLERRRKMLAR